MSQAAAGHRTARGSKSALVVEYTCPEEGCAEFEDHMKSPRVPESFAALIFIGLCVMTIGRAASGAEERYVPFEGSKSAWHDGFERYDFVMDGKTMAITPFNRPGDEKFGIG